MPVDASKPSSSRRPQRKITEEELRDIELKRIRGELSCAECRRLKLRCDKKVPCSSCVRRGCESICPCGILSAGQGTRFILADTQQLHRKISEMSSRIRALEDALAILQATVSSERHPLLSDDLLKIKFGAEALRSDVAKSAGSGGGDGSSGTSGIDGNGEPVVKTEEQENIDALGTLTLDDKSGEVKYFGRSAGSETLLMASEEWAAPSAEDGETFDDAADDHPFEYPFSVNPYSSTSSSTIPSFNPSAAPSPDPSSPPSYHAQAQGHSASTPISTHSSGQTSTNHQPSAPSTSSQNSLPPLSRLSNLFPFTSPIPPSIWKSGGAGLSAATMRKLHERQNLLDLLYAYLPQYNRANELAESYLQHATYFFRPIKRDELLGESSNLPGMPLPEDNHDPTIPSSNDFGSSGSTPTGGSRGFLAHIYDAASKRQLRQLHTFYSDAGSPASSNGDTTEGSTPVSPTQSQSQPQFNFPPAVAPSTSTASFGSSFSSSAPSAGARNSQQVNSNTTQPQANNNTVPDTDPDPSAPHALATLFMILALGALLDIRNPPYNAEAEGYYILGKAALSLRTVFDFPSIRSVQAVGLMATYHSLAGKKYSRDSAWGLMSLAAKLSQSLGLHRDSARWKLDATTVQRRRSLFWEIFASDVSHSLALGRPPAIHLSYVDCEFPIDEEATLSDTQEIQYGFWRMKHTFARDIFNAVAETTLTAKSPSYSTVLDLDRKVRELSFPAAFKPYVSKEDGEEEYYSSSLSLRGFYASQHRTVTMLYLHRSFFAQAMLDHPNNPLLSPFAPSFLTAYRCASIIIKATAHQFDRCAAMAMRVWFLLYHTFSAAVIVGTVVTHSPTSNMASSALLDLSLAVDLFEKASTKSRRARIALDVLRKLKEKAVRSWTQYCSATLPTQVGSGAESTNSSPLSMFNSPTSSFKSPKGDGSDDDGGDELAIFGGQKKVLTRKHRHTSSNSISSAAANSSNGSPHHPPSNGDSPSPPHTGANGTPSPPTMYTEPGVSFGAQQQQRPNVHPSLMEYLDQTNLFGLENMGSAAPNIPANPFAGPNASLSMGGEPHRLNTNPVSNAMQGVESVASGSRTGPSLPGSIPPSMMAMLQSMNGADAPGQNGGDMGDMYQSFMSYLANRSIGGNAPNLQGLQQAFTRSPPSTHPPSAMQSRQTSVSPSAPNSVVNSPSAPWPASGYSSPTNTVHPPMWGGSAQTSPTASPSAPQGLASGAGRFVGQGEMLAFAGALGPVQRQQHHPTLRHPPPAQGGFNGYPARMDANMFGGSNAYAGQPVGQGFNGVGLDSAAAPGMMSVDPREHLVEMGLTTESGMDAGWMSFMRDVGIMEYGVPGNGHQMSL